MNNSNDDESSLGSTIDPDTGRRKSLRGRIPRKVWDSRDLTAKIKGNRKKAGKHDNSKKNSNEDKMPPKKRKSMRSIAESRDDLEGEGA